MIVEGVSVSGVATRLHLPEIGLTFDLGACPIEFVPKGDRVAFTHGHMDHAAGAPYLLAMRELMRMRVPEVIIPFEMAVNFSQFITAAEALDDSEYSALFHTLTSGEAHDLGKGLTLTAYPMTHAIPSSAYVVHRGVKRLKPEFWGKPGKELGVLRKGGVVLEDNVLTPIVAYTGDTSAQGLDENPILYEVEHLLVECTYLGDTEKDNPSRATAMGHIHIEDLIARADKFRNKEITLVHPSARYERRDLLVALEELPETLRSRTHWL